MIKTESLGLPIYDTPEVDIFDLQDFNDANQSLEGAYKEIIEFKTNIPLVNASAEVLEARKGKQTLKEKIDEVDAQLAEKANKGGNATIYIASSNATASEKQRANIVCDGVNDYELINNAINAILPKETFKVPGATLVAPYGKVIFSTGVFKLNTRLTIPKGSRIIFEGQGRSYQDIDFGGKGGTIISGTDINGILYCPFNIQWGDCTTFVARDLDFRQDAVQTHNANAVDLIGVMSGGLENVGIINDKSISGVTCQDGFGLNADNGSYGNSFWLLNIDVGAFGANGRYCCVLGSNHCWVDNLHLNGGNGVANALKITTIGDKFDIGSLHIFQFGTDNNTTNLIKLIDFSAQPTNKVEVMCLIRNLSLESIRPRQGQTGNFINFADDKVRVHFSRIHDNVFQSDFNVLNNTFSYVTCDHYGGKSIKPYQVGFGGSVPAIPEIGESNKVINNKPYTILIYNSGNANITIVDQQGNKRDVGKMTCVMLPPRCSLFTAVDKISWWHWFGM